MLDLVILGGGIAGITAGIYALRAGLKVKLVESTGLGGQLLVSTKIENFPLARGLRGPEFAQNLAAQASELGLSVVYEKVEALDLERRELKLASGKTLTARAVILATGTTVRKLGLAREEDFTGRGLSYCATCDGAFFKDQAVAVYGGGDTAVSEAIYLAALARSVTIILRRDQFRANPKDVQKMLSLANVKVIYTHQISALVGTQKLEALKLTPTAPSSSSSLLPVSALFMAIGRLPALPKLIPSAKNPLLFDEAGFIKAAEDGVTSVPGIFVVGDLRHKQLRQLVTAAADGANAVSSAIDFLQA